MMQTSSVNNNNKTSSFTFVNICFALCLMYLQMKIMIESFKVKGIIKYNHDKINDIFFPSLTICSNINNLNFNSTKCLYKSNGLSIKHRCHFSIQNECIKFKTNHLISNSVRSEEIHISLNAKPFYEPLSGKNSIPIFIFLN